MRKVLLLFPDVISISDFVLTEKVSKVIIDSSRKTLKGIITEKQLQVACKEFNAKVKESVFVKV
jgi:hypothetical protein